MKFILIFILLFSCAKTSHSIPPKAIDGKLDLTNWNFTKENSIFLDGEWEFFHEEIGTLSEENRDLILVPSSWHNTKTIKKKLLHKADGFATYKLKVKLNSNHEELIFKVKRLFTAYKLYVNNELYSEQGEFGKQEIDSKPKLISVHSKLIPKNLNELEILVIISNFHHRKSGFVNSIELSTVEKIFDSQVNLITTDIFLASGIYVLFLIHLGLFFLSVKDSFYLYFGLACFCIGTQTLVTGEMFILRIFPNIEWELLNKLDYLTTYSTVAFYSLFLSKLFPKEFNKYLNLFFCYCCFGFNILVLVTKSRTYSLYNPHMELIIILSFIYFLVSLFLASWNRSKGGLAFFISTILTFIATLNDIFFDISFYHSTLFTPYSLYIIFSSQAFILSIRYVEAFKQNELFRIELEESKKDLEQKVANRTKDFYLKNYELNLAKIEAEKSNKIKTDFLANVSHEIRTPLNGVIGITSLLKDSNLTEEQRNYLNVISNCGESIITIINDILDLSKIESGNLKFENREFKIIKLISESIDLFSAKSKEKNIIVKFNYDPILRDSVFLGDKTRISQIVNNLLSNAIKFCSTDGFISINLNSEIESNSSRLKFEIHDTGIGISENKLEEIFEPFKQSDVSISRKFGGTGLGLSICKKLIQMMKGSIFVKSKLGEGSSFYFNILLENVSSAKELNDRKFISSNLNESYPFEILVVDDNSLNQMIIKKFLNKLGYKKIELVSSGLEAIEFLKSRPFDLVFMDIDMPELDGIETTKQIRQNLKLDLIIVAFTANAIEGDKEKYLDFGFDDHLTKPVFIERLFELLNFWGDKRFQKN